ncbi:zinc finger protein 438 [Corythoichthys intestinalis]|uniref:zinc finger protein 438 n=1 Tax=Corythoichthys intestinalis TaxID=161448 RepID=UPI0025A5A99B|nr:zinc finger protein 438 [Corythoichthys intestinalis]XP_057680587.1 zinc finger protein 438 [Corythoichthys intestinalis]XP_057680588.1 zinc finger protein 438 [Corythoichthys intestinalis]XP_061809881.1 zinc finger protein 438-like [Nerophis lumbriciformis]
MKSLQFRSIAPKAPVIVPSPSSAVLSCQLPPSLPEASSGSSPKSIVVPTQNYALMQIAGQDGTFSLVALPPSVSQTTQQQQQPQQTHSIQNNPKLPIPRYKPMRSVVTPDKVKLRPVARRVNTATGETSTAQLKTLVSSTSTLIKKKKEECAVTQIQKLKQETSEQVIFIDPAHSEISVPALLPENAVLGPGSQLEQAPVKAEEPGATSIQNPCQTLPTALKTCPVKSLEQSGAMMRICQSKPASAQPQNSIAVISPAIFSKAVQIIPSAPKGKLPILPYSKMKNTLIPAAKLNMTQDKKGCLNQSGPMSPKEPTSSFHETSEALTPNSSRQPQNKNSLIPLLGNLQKMPGKKRGRKRKTMEDILAYEARKKRSLSFFRRRVPEKPLIVISGSKQKEVDISKKYRSIQPKPVLVMETVPQLLSLPACTLDGQEPELLPSHQLPTPKATMDQDRPPQHSPVTLHLSGTAHSRILVASRYIYRCPTCSRCFQFKQHLQSHMNSHTNSRPYACPVCRKAYAHSGSLSTHMKVHHSEARSRRSLRCEFCEKAFGYVGVYFSHLREVHKVLLTVEPSIKHEESVAVDGENSEPSNEEDHKESVELQIKCGRCQVATSSFADMKMHLLYVHGEEVQVHLQGDQPLPGGHNAEKELVKHAAHYWRQLNKKRSLVKCGNCDEEFLSFAKLKRHIMFHHCGSEGEDREPVQTSAAVGCNGVLAVGSAFNCVLCSKMFDTKEGVLAHWRGYHHCEQPSLLWAALSAYSGMEDDDCNLESPDSNPL